MLSHQKAASTGNIPEYRPGGNSIRLPHWTPVHPRLLPRWPQRRQQSQLYILSHDRRVFNTCSVYHAQHARDADATAEYNAPALQACGLLDEPQSRVSCKELARTHGMCSSSTRPHAMKVCSSHLKQLRSMTRCSHPPRLGHQVAAHQEKASLDPTIMALDCAKSRVQATAVHPLRQAVFAPSPIRTPNPPKAAAMHRRARSHHTYLQVPAASCMPSWTASPAGCRSARWDNLASFTRARTYHHGPFCASAPPSRAQLVRRQTRPNSGRATHHACFFCCFGD
jgi:hypothetical protein